MCFVVLSNGVNNLQIPTAVVGFDDGPIRGLYWYLERADEWALLLVGLFNGCNRISINVL